MSKDVAEAEVVEAQVEPEAPKTTEERIAELEAAMKQTVIVCNNLIQFCNTIERWRRMEFLTDEEIKKRQEAEAEAAKLAEKTDAPAE
mgnify:CR=1 FL=1